MCIIESRSFNKNESMKLSKAGGFLIGNLSQMNQVAFVPHKNADDIRRSEFVQLCNPIQAALERRSIGNVIHQYGSCSVPVISLTCSAVSLSSMHIPQVKFVQLIVITKLSLYEFYACRRLGFQIKFIGDISSQNHCFSH